MDFTVFVTQIADAYLHIYDLVYLRTQPLAHFVTPQADVQYKKKAWILHDVLLGLIEELDPGFNAPADGREKRRYRLLSMRYGEGSSSKAVADALAISLRHYYREHDAAIEAVATILWQRYGHKSQSDNSSPSSAANSPIPPDEPANRQAMLRAEAAHFQNFGHATRLDEVLAGVMELAQELAHTKGIRITLEPSLETPPLPIDRTVLRQILLGLLSYLGEQLAEGEIRVRVRTENQQQIVEVVGNGLQTSTIVHQDEEQIATLYELAGLQAAHLEILQEAEEGIGFRLRLPRAPRRTVLLVDDNGDILELYQRYLQHGYYQAVPVQSGQEALSIASQLHPQVIVLDLMLPEQDGWEILQRLTNHPDTQTIPVVICSILRARQLALALGASAFLEKPVDETEFLRVLDTLSAP